MKKPVEDALEKEASDIDQKGADTVENREKIKGDLQSQQEVPLFSTTEQEPVKQKTVDEDFHKLQEVSSVEFPWMLCLECR